MASDQLLYLQLAKALGQPSRAYRAASEALNVPGQAVEGYRAGAQLGDEVRKRRLGQQTLSDALGGRSLEEGIMNLTGEGGAAQNTNIDNLIAYDKARKEANRGKQLFGTRGDKGLVYDPNNSTISETPLPAGDGPIIPKAVTPTMTPYADPNGQPLAYTPGQGMAPVPSKGGTPVVKTGNEQAVGDVALMQSQVGNIDKLFDAYAEKGPIAARLQATPAGGVLDPEAKQYENSLKLAAFTFGGKNLTGQEKQVVFGAFFPSVTDNAASLEQKRSLLKDYFAGKTDLLQAANLLGPAGAPLAAMLKAKAGGSQNPANPAATSTVDPEAENAIARINSSSATPAHKQALIAAVRARSGHR